MSSMMAATRSKSDKLPENEIISKATKMLKEKKRKKQENEKKKESDSWGSQKVSPRRNGEEEEIPYAGVKPLPVVTREKQPVVEEEKEEQKWGYRNKAPLQDDERAISLIKESLKTPINVTTEDLLNISQTARQELKKLLTKKRVEKQVTLLAKEEQAEKLNIIHAEQLPSASYEVLEEERSGMPKGSVTSCDW